MKNFIKTISKLLKNLHNEVKIASEIAYGNDYIFTDRFGLNSKKR